MKNILKTLNINNTLSEASKQILITKFEKIIIKKEKGVATQFNPSKYIYFIEEGAVKNHYINDEGEITVVWFGFESDICILLSEYLDIDYYPAHFELLEDCSFYRAPLSDLKQLYKTNIEWANWGREITENLLIKTYKEIDEYRSMDAKSRYLHLIENNENIKNRVPIKDIASYLGVSPVTISRIRKLNS